MSIVQKSISREKLANFLEDNRRSVRGEGCITSEFVVCVDYDTLIEAIESGELDEEPEQQKAEY